MAGNVPLSQIALCTLQEVKNLIDPKLSADQDPLLVQLINGFSDMMQSERFLNRRLLKQEYVEVFDGHHNILIVTAPPIILDGTFSVIVDEGHVFNDGADPPVALTALTLWDDYTVRPEIGLIRSLYGEFSSEPYSVQVTYNGGLVINDEANDTIDVPDGLRTACAMQVSFWFQRRRELGITSVSSAGGDATFFAPTKLLPIVEQEIGQYRHHRI